jgi:hypothetical protein
VEPSIKNMEHYRVVPGHVNQLPAGLRRRRHPPATA